MDDNSVDNALSGFRDLFKEIHANEADSLSLDEAVDQLHFRDVNALAIVLLSHLKVFSTAHFVPFKVGSNLDRLMSAVLSKELDSHPLKHLLKAALSDTARDGEIWDIVDIELLTAVSQEIKSWLHHSNSFPNSFEYQQHVDNFLRQELGPLNVGVTGFHDAFFGRVPILKENADVVFKLCKTGSDPLFDQGWKGWPRDGTLDTVFRCFDGIIRKLGAFAAEYDLRPPQTSQRQISQPAIPIPGSPDDPKMDIGFVSNPTSKTNTWCNWSQILIPGQLNSSPSADIASKTWLDIGRSAKKIFSTQDTRRYVLGFTLCGSLMRVWEFDRGGGIASEQFDINKNGLQFVYTILGFLYLNEKDLGFDPTIISSGKGKRYVEIQRNGCCMERLVIDGLIQRGGGVSSRGTTCWKAHPESDPTLTLVIKDSWQYPERLEEGELLREVTQKGVTNVARYYHHETVHVDSIVDDVFTSVRRGLEVSQSTKSSTTNSISTIGPLHGSNMSDNPRPEPRAYTINNRIHRRVVLRDYGRPIYKASSPVALLRALEGCVEGLESLYNAGIIHRDISLHNLMIHESETETSETSTLNSFLIDLDLAVQVTNQEAQYTAENRIGTKAFMSIGVLTAQRDRHSFMDDLESIFWVLYWICIHFVSPEKSRVVPQFDAWNYMSLEDLGRLKFGEIAIDAFDVRMEDIFTPYYKCLIPWVGKLRTVVFPDGRPWRRENEKLFESMKRISRQGQRALTK